ncbi:MAG: TonB-dependent receptor [Rubrivivax sp.]|nr:MAG: TonB-dependent receptor [Rubrivivax sp.]
MIDQALRDAGGKWKWTDGLFAAALTCGWAVAAQAQPADAASAAPLPAVVVTATRSPQALPDAAAAIDVVDGATIRTMGPQVNLSEALQRVPGLGVLNRQNYAQDLQISSRGFGARSAFGVRGVRLYADGIPATMPDGQGQSALFDLGSAERIEVLRGPASALYGNASGGVIQVFTEDGPPRPELSLGLALGRDGFHREQLKLGGEAAEGAFNYVINASHFETDGYRDHSAARRDQFNTKLRWRFADRATLTLVGSYLNMPEVLDPLGLSEAQWRAAPRSAVSNAVGFNTRKNIENSQLGLVYERPVRHGEDTLRVMVYDGQRQVRQFQAIPTGPQAAPRHPGGVIDFSRDYAGLDTRYTWRHTLLSRPLQLTGGFSLDRMTESRQGYQNFIGSQTGVVGALRRDEDNTARNRDQYLQGQWAVAERWDLGLGLRHSRVGFDSQDRYIVGPNGDDSGGQRFSATTPTASVMFKASPAWHWYAAVGRSFETPTLNETAYRAANQSGLNLDLRASKARHAEVGVKARPLSDVQFNATLFHVETDDEIAVARSEGGRTTYQNVGRTRRQGAEASGSWRIAPGWSAFAALTWTDAQYQDSFTSTAVVNGVSTATTVAAGRKLPGVAARVGYAELAWRPASSGWQGALEVRHSARLWANDLNTAFAPASTVWAARAGWRQVWQGWRLEALARIDNLTDQAYVGSVIVNDGNGRFFEPAAGRSLLLSTTLTRVF